MKYIRDENGKLIGTISDNRSDRAEELPSDGAMRFVSGMFAVIAFAIWIYSGWLIFGIATLVLLAIFALFHWQCSKY